MFLGLVGENGFKEKERGIEAYEFATNGETLRRFCYGLGLHFVVWSIGLSFHQWSNEQGILLEYFEGIFT